MGKITIAILALMTALNQAFSQPKIYHEECSISKLLIQYDNTTCNGYLVVDSSKHFYCYPEPIDSFMDVTDLYSRLNIGTILPNIKNIDDSTNLFLITEPPLAKYVRFNEDNSRIETVKNSFSKDIPDFKESSEGKYRGIITTMPKRITIENAYLQSKFGYDKGDAIARFIVPDYYVFRNGELSRNQGFYCISIYKQSDKKYTITSSYGSAEYPQGFVVKNTKTYKHLGTKNKKLTSALNLYNRRTSIKDSIWLNWAYPYYVEIGNRKFLISSDAKETVNSSLLKLCEEVCSINKNKRLFRRPYLIIQ